jgi:esterase/lipase
MPEDQVSINQIGEQLNKVIQEEQSLNEGKVIVGGFSLGGSMAIHLGYRLNQSIAGVFALSSFLPPCSSVFSVSKNMYLYRELYANQRNSFTQSLTEFVKENPQVESEEFTRTIISQDGKMANTGKKESRVSKKKLPKLFMSRGTRDPLVRPRWTHSTFTQLRVLLQSTFNLASL